MIDNRQPVIFCDFDGTITEHDVVVMIMEAFAPPEWKAIVDRILNQRTLSIRDGMTQLFALIPGSKREEIEAYVTQSVRLRLGFPTFLDFCERQDIPFVVISGGLDFFIEPVLAPFREKLAVFCNRASFQPDRIDVTYPHASDCCDPCGECGTCKISILETYPVERYFRIAIGDSLTDLGIAKVADWMFARDRLMGYCQEADIPFTAFNTFRDIEQALLKTTRASQGR